LLVAIVRKNTKITIYEYMKLLLFIGTGSFFGGILRYLLSNFIQSKYLTSFPLGTIGVNIIGCFFIEQLLEG
jgi:fluoride ion exporter CrcB/FEX